MHENGRHSLSRRVNSLRPSGIRKFFDIAATMKNVISLGVGEPDFTTPDPILEAGVHSLRAGADTQGNLTRGTIRHPFPRGGSEPRNPARVPARFQAHAPPRVPAAPLPGRP